MQLPAAVRAWVHDAPVVLVPSGSGCRVYRVGTPGKARYLKVSARSSGVLRNEFRRLSWARHHLPVPRVIGYVESGAEAYLALAEIPGEIARDAAQARHSRSPAAIARALARWHRIPPALCPFRYPLADVIGAAALRWEAGQTNLKALSPWLKRQPGSWWLETFRTRLAVRSAPVVAHGDYALGNIVLDPRGRVCGFLDLADTGLADPHHDLAVAASSLLHLWGEDARDAFLDTYGRHRIDPVRLELYTVLHQFFA